MATADERIGRLLVDKGVLDGATLDACLRELLRRREKGAQAVLLDLLQGRGLATPERVAAALEGAGEVAFRCPKCRSRNVTQKPRADVLYACKRCAVTLETDDAPAPPPPPEPTSPTLRAWVPEAPAPARVLGKYRLDEELGRGGSAVVWKAWDSSLQQHVALKVMRRDAADAEEVEAFLREARLAARLSHPSIVRVFEVGRHDERPFISMEFVENGSLAALLKPGKGRGLPFYRDVPRFVRLLKQVADALDHAHRQSPPIVHRDVKPSNILIHADGRACLADFGLAHESRGGGRLTLDHIAKGTPCYMSPEQARGGRGRLDARTDVWALGAVLYEALAGRPPFIGESDLDILRKVVEQEPERPSEILARDGVHPASLPALERVCMKALEKDPNRRYPSAGAFARDLAAFQTGRPVTARRAVHSGRALKWAWKNKAVFLPSVAAVVFAGIALFALLRVPPPAAAPPPPPPSTSAPAAALAAAEARQHLLRLRLTEAVEHYERAIAAETDPARRKLYQAEADDAPLLDALLSGVASRIRAGGRELAEFRTRSETWAPARVTDATSQKVVVRAQGKIQDVPWPDVDPGQFSALAAQVWPDVAGPAAKGLEAWRRLHALKPPAAPKPAEPAAITTAPVPVDLLGLRGVHAEGRRAIVQALRERDFVEAARQWMLLGSDPRPPFDPTPTLKKLSAGEIPAAEIRGILPDVESWIPRESADSVALRLAFALRDLLSLSLACVDAKAAIDRLADAKVEVFAPSLPIRGFVARSKDGPTIGGRAVHVTRGGAGTRLSGRDLVSLMREDRRRSKAAPDWRSRLGEALLRVYDGGPLPWTTDLEEWDAVEAGLPPDAARGVRLYEYRMLARLGGTWSLDLTADEGLWKGTHKGPGVTLPNLEEAVAGTRSGIPAGLRLEVRLRFVRPAPDAALVMAFTKEELEPTSAFVFTPGDGEVGLRIGDRTAHRLGAPGGLLDFMLDVGPADVGLSIGDQGVLTLRDTVGPGRGLWLGSRNVEVRVERLVARERPPDDLRPPATLPDPSGRSVEALLKDAQAFETAGRPKDAAMMYSLAILRRPQEGDFWTWRGTHLHDLGEWENARADFARAIQLGARSAGYARLYLWMERTRLGEGAAATAQLKASRSGAAVTAEVAWTQRLADLLTGEASEDAVLGEAKANFDAKIRKELECEAYFYAGMKRLLEGERLVGQALLRRCVDTDVRTFIEWRAAKVELARP